MRCKQLLITIMMILLLTATNAYAKKIPFGERQDVQKFIQMMTKEYHFNAADLTKLFNTVVIYPRILHKLDHPKEKEPWILYKKIFITHKRVLDGVAFWHAHKAALAKAEKIYGVPPNIIVAIIGIESNYGKQLGHFRVIDTLSDITFNYSKRTHFFRNELKAFLLFCRKWHLDPQKVYGSYAGAISEAQFMPSSILQYAVDFDHSGKRSILHSQADVIGSIANYLSMHGWTTDHAMMVRATLAENHKQNLNINNILPTLSPMKFKQYGIKPARTLPYPNVVGLIRIRTHHGDEYWIGLHNFFVITQYNSNILYAIATYQLSQKIKFAFEQQYQK